MNTDVRIPIPVPTGIPVSSTTDAAELSGTRERAAAYARAQEAHGRYLAGAVGDQDAAVVAVVEQDQRTRAMIAYAHTATRGGVTRLVTNSALASAVTVGAWALFGPLGGVVVVVGGVVGLKLWGGGR